LSRRFTTSFNSIADKLIEDLKLRGAPRTHKVAIAPINHLRKTFGKKKIALIKDHMFWDLHVPRARKENPKRNLNKDRKLFIQVLNHAKYLRLISSGPGKIAKPNLTSDIGREVSDEELQLLINHSPKVLKFQIEIAVNTGMRKGEIFSIRYDYCDLNRNIIHLPKEVTKTRRGRGVPISTELSSKIKAMKEISNSPYIFPGKYSNELPQCDNKRGWQRARRVSGVSCRFHDLRHTAATRKLRAGASMGNVSLVMGMGERVLRDIYQHLTVEDLRPTAVSGAFKISS